MAANSNKAITFSYKGKDYTLEFNRAVVQSMERAQFKPDQIAEYPSIMVPMLVEGAFRMHHPTIKKSLVSEIYDGIPGKMDFISKLIELYAEPVNALMAEPDEGDAGNVKWTANW